MSFLEQFLKESSVGRSRDPLNSAASGSNSGRPDRVSVDSSTATATRRGMSIESDEGDVEDNRAGSITSSRSNMSEVSFIPLENLSRPKIKINLNFPARTCVTRHQWSNVPTPTSSTLTTSTPTSTPVTFATSHSDQRRTRRRPSRRRRRQNSSIPHSNLQFSLEMQSLHLPHGRLDPPGCGL